MKSFFPILVIGLLALLWSSSDLYGQFSTQEPGNKDKETNLQTASNPKLSIGKSMTYAGIGVFLAHCIHDQFIPESKLESNMEYIIGLSSILVGIPLWLSGKDKEINRQGIQYTGTPRGFSMRADLSWGIIKVRGVDFTAGYHFNPYWYLGAGIGYHQATIESDYLIPYYVEGKVTLSNRRVAPYLGVKAGFAYHDSDQSISGTHYYIGTDAGVRIRNKHKDAGRGDWWISGFIEGSPSSCTFSGIKIGYAF